MLTSLLGLTAPAEADHCDSALHVAAKPSAFAASAAFEAASFRNPRFEGTWIGLRPEMSVTLGRFVLRGWVPVYRLERNGLGSAGVGDAGLGARVEAWRSEPGHTSAGLLATATAPTGSAAEHLGMGHPMASAGLWWSFARDRLAAGGAVAYARTLGSSGHHRGPAPLVDPMNASEVVASARAGWLFAGLVRPEVGVLVAEPVADTAGARRAWGTAGVVLTTAWADVSLVAQLPLAGDAFRARTLLTATVRR